MKIKLSLRIYFLVAMVLLGVGMAASFSTMTIDHFIKGYDISLKSMMIATARAMETDGQLTPETLGFNVATQYEQVPEEFRRHIPTPPTKPYQLKKKVIQSTILSRPETIYFVMLVKNKEGYARYVSKAIVQQRDHPTFPPDSKSLGLEERLERWGIVPRVAIFGFTVVVVFAILVLLLMRSITSPVASLKNWAKSLDVKQLKLPPPNFHYSELNTLATIIHNSLNSMQKSLEREHDFLRHASHELRTPIAVIRSNLELLKKLNGEPGEKEKVVLGRLERASFTMSHLTETLLWLSREKDAKPPSDNIQLDVLIKQVIADLAYLLQFKQVKVIARTSPHRLYLPATACQIMLTNLIRNAFQHTHSGEVIIEQHRARVSIRNQNQANLPADPNELGFGLGLTLTRKLARRFGWHYNNFPERVGHDAEVFFE